MHCLTVSKLPEGPNWIWEIKLDGYRCEGMKTNKKVTLYSRLENSLNAKHPYIVEALEGMPDDTVIDSKQDGRNHRKASG
jgi:ATP-dependent DNA ligase